MKFFRSGSIFMAGVGSGSTFPGSVSADSNPDQNEVDPHTIFEDLFYTYTGRRFSSLILALPGLSRKYIFNLFYWNKGYTTSTTIQCSRELEHLKQKILINTIPKQNKISFNVLAEKKIVCFLFHTPIHPTENKKIRGWTANPKWLPLIWEC